MEKNSQGKYIYFYDIKNHFKLLAGKIQKNQIINFYNFYIYKVYYLQ